MDHFLAGFEKRAVEKTAVLGRIVRGLSHATGSVVGGARRAAAAVKNAPNTIRQSAREGYQAGKSSHLPKPGSKDFMGPMPQNIVHGQAPTPLVQQTTEAVKKVPGRFARTRGAAKAVVAGGLIGAGGTAAFSGDGSQPQPTGY